MTKDQRNLIITALGKISGQLNSCTFESYGSLSLQMNMACLLEIRDCITYPDNPGTHLIDQLILSFSEIV